MIEPQTKLFVVGLEMNMKVGISLNVMPPTDVSEEHWSTSTRCHRITSQNSECLSDALQYVAERGVEGKSTKRYTLLSQS
jgi:hypothetical protein